MCPRFQDSKIPASTDTEPPQRLMVREGSRLVPMDIRTGFTYPR
jgi:hypothetical protein